MAAKIECGECGKPVKEKFHDQHMERVHGRRIQVYASGYAGDGIRTDLSRSPKRRDRQKQT